jgi:hypothetical protein
MRPDEALVAIRRKPARRSSRSSQGLPRYITDKQPAIATKLVIEFVVCGPKPATCKVALSKCLSGESACRGTGAELKTFTTLIRVFHKDPTIPLIRLPACINLNKVVFEPGNVNNWASSAQISIDEEWVDESKSVSEAYLISFWSDHRQGAKFSVNIHGQDYDVFRRRAIYPDFLRTSKRKAWSKWLGPLAFADQDKPFTFYHPNIKVVDIKRNVVGEIVSCRLQQVTDSAPAIRRGTADLV